MAMFPDAGPSRPPGNLPYKPSPGDNRSDWRRDGYEPRERGFTRDGRDARDGRDPRDSRDGPPARGPYPYRREAPGFRPGYPRSRSPSPSRRFDARDRPYERPGDDQWRPPPRSLPPSRDGRDRDWDRDYRRERFRDDPRSNPPSVGPSPPERARSPPFRSSRPFSAQTPPTFAPRIPSGPRGTATPAPRETPRGRDDRFAGRDTSRTLETPTAGPSNLPAPRAPRSMRGSSSPVDILRSKTDQSPATAPTRTVPLPSDIKSELDADLEEGEVVSPVKPLAPLAPWVKREEDRERARRGTWEYDRTRDRTFDRERDRDWDRRPSYRFGGGSTSPQKRRSRSPLAVSRREEPIPQRTRSNSNPTDRRRAESLDAPLRETKIQAEEKPRDAVIRPATPEDPPGETKPRKEAAAVENAPDRQLTPLEPEAPEKPTGEKLPSLSLQVNIVEPIGRPDTPASPRPSSIPPPGRPDTPASPLGSAQALIAQAPPVIIKSSASPQPEPESSIKTPQEIPQSPRGESSSPPGHIIRTPPRPDTPATPLPPSDNVGTQEVLTQESVKATDLEDNSAGATPSEIKHDIEASTVVAASSEQEDISMVSPARAADEENEELVPGPIRHSSPARPVIGTDSPTGLAVSAQPAKTTSSTVASEPTAPDSADPKITTTTVDPPIISPGPPQRTLPTETSPRVTIAERRGLVSLPTPAGPLSSPFGQPFPRRDPQPTSASDIDTDYGPRTAQTEIPPTPHVWVDEDEDERLNNLIGSVKAEQGRKIVFDEHRVLSVNNALTQMESSRVNAALLTDNKRNEWIEEITWPMAHTRVASLVTKIVQKESESEKEKAERLKDEYQQWHADWMLHCSNLDTSMRKRGQPPAELYAVPNSVLIFPPAPVGPAPSTPVEDIMMGGTRRRRNMGDAVATEADFEAILADLADDAAKDPNLRASKTSAVVPDMLPYEERKMAYDDDNDIVNDPLSFYDYDGIAEPIWTEEERATFLRRYLSHPKQFGKISEVLPNKTAAECVAFYYRTKKDVDYKGMLASRRGDKKKKLPIKNAGKGSALLSNLGQQKPTINAATTPGPRSAITPARKDENGKSRQKAKDSGASTPIPAPRKRIEGEDETIDSGTSRAGSETPSLIKHKMRVSMKGPKRPRMSSVTDLAALATVSAESPAPTQEMPEELADPPEPAPNGNGTIPADLLPPVKRAGKRRKVDPNDPTAVVEEKDPNKTSSRRPTTNSYWSVEEKKKFRELVVQHGNDARLIAAELGGKSERQVSNFYEAHKTDMRLDDLAKGGEEAIAELNRMNGPPEPRPESREAKTVAFGQNQPASFARSIYDVYPSSVRRSDAFEQRFAEPRLGMFPPSPPHGQSNLSGESAPPRSGGMRISALLNDEPTGDSKPRQPSPVGQASFKYDADAASDGTVSERDGEGGVTRPSPRSLPPVPAPYPHQGTVYDPSRRPSDSYDRPEPYRSVTSQPYEHPSAYYSHPPARAATAAPSLPPQPRGAWEAPRPPYAEYQRDPYYSHGRPLPPAPHHGMHPPHPAQPAHPPHPHSVPHHPQPHPQHPQQHSPQSHHPPRHENWRPHHSGSLPPMQQGQPVPNPERRYEPPSQSNGSGQ